MEVNAIDRFENSKSIVFDGDTDLKFKAYTVHQRLLERNTPF